MRPAAAAIILSLPGLPGIYVHSLLGSRSWTKGVAQTGHNRTINRQKLDRASLESELADPASLRHQVFSAYRRPLRARASDSAFNPYGPQEVLSLHLAVFVLLYTPPGGGRVLCLHNVSGRTQRLDPEAGDWPLASTPWRDLLTSQAVTPRGGEFSLPPLRRPLVEGVACDVKPVGLPSPPRLAAVGAPRADCGLGRHWTSLLVQQCSYCRFHPISLCFFRSSRVDWSSAPAERDPDPPGADYGPRRADGHVAVSKSRSPSTTDI